MARSDVTMKIGLPRAGETRAFLGTSTVQQTILDQLYLLNPNYRWDYGVKAVFTLTEEGKEGIQLHTRNPGKVINIRILYNKGTDEYDIRAYRIKGVDVTEIYSGDGIPWDNLDTAIAGIIRGRRR